MHENEGGKSTRINQQWVAWIWLQTQSASSCLPLNWILTLVYQWLAQAPQQQRDKGRHRYIYIKFISFKCKMVSLLLFIIPLQVFSSNQNSCHGCCDKYISKADNSDLDCIPLYKLFNKYLWIINTVTEIWTYFYVICEQQRVRFITSLDRLWCEDEISDLARHSSMYINSATFSGLINF